MALATEARGIIVGIGEYFWRLIPANPILLRVVEMNGKRRRDLFIRCGYLGLLIGVVLVSLMGGGGSGDFAELTKTSTTLFQNLSYCQLFLVALLAPIFTAGAITQEKDSQTYDILLATPLTNGQILLGSLLSRLFFVVALLICGIPVFSIIRIFGGVAIDAIVQSILIAAATAFVTGAIAMSIATLKVGSRRTIFGFYLFIVIYLAGTYMLDQYTKFKVLNSASDLLKPGADLYKDSDTSWMTGLNPFLALKTIFHGQAYSAPAMGDLRPGDQKWPFGWYLTNPASFYITFMFLISFVLISPSILLLRKLAQSSTSIHTLVLQRLGITRGDRTRKPRVVWTNPIAWREAKTSVSTGRGSLLRHVIMFLLFGPLYLVFLWGGARSPLRYGFMALGLVGTVVIAWMYYTVEPAKTTFEGDKLVQYIRHDSYDAQNKTLTIYRRDGSDAETYTFDPVHVTEAVADDPSSRYRNTNQYWSQPTPPAVVSDSPTLKVTYIDPRSPEAAIRRDNKTKSNTKADLTKDELKESATDEIQSIESLMDHARRGELSVVARARTDTDTRKQIWSTIEAYAPHRQLGALDARTIYLLVNVVEFALILLIVSNAAASTVTREKEDGSLDLLLSSPITSRYYIWGKLRGLVSFVLPLVAVPAASALIFVLWDCWHRMGDWDDPLFRWMIFPEAILLMPAVLIVTVAFAAILGMNMSLRCRKTVVAVMGSIGIMAAICAALALLGWLMLGRHGTAPVGLGVAGFSPFTLLAVLINPYAFNTGSLLKGDDIYSDDAALGSRIVVIILALIAVLAYLGIVWKMYTSMVKNFDMTIRKQST